MTAQGLAPTKDYIDMDIASKARQWLRKFAALQENGRDIKPNSTDTTVCKHCGTTFQGNFCPRCGQSRAVSKVTRRGFVLTFMEAYPLLASTFLRTVEELVYRPGYMIRDYFRGHRVIYCGPFKTFILMASMLALLNVCIDNAAAPHAQNTEAAAEGKKITVGTSTMNVSIDTEDDADNEGEEAVVSALEKIRRTNERLSTNKWTALWWNFIKAKAEDNNTNDLLFVIPLLALGGHVAFRKTTFDGRRLLYAEHFMVFTYLYCASTAISIIIYASELPLTGSGARPTSHYLLTLIYMAWTYKGLYGWTWPTAARQTLRLMAWQALFFLAALAAFAAAATAVIVVLAQDAA